MGVRVDGPPGNGVDLTIAGSGESGVPDPGVIGSLMAPERDRRDVPGEVRPIIAGQTTFPLMGLGSSYE